MKEGIRPGIRLIESCELKFWRQRERRAITLFRKKGHNLFNVHRGGNGQEDGKLKIYCGICGTKKTTTPAGHRRCANCRNKSARIYSQTKAGRKAARRRRRSEKGRAARRRWQQSEAGLASARRWQQSEAKRAVNQRWRQTKAGQDYHLKYEQDRSHAKKLGLTVKEYRAKI